eukprot:CAMPEP_0172798560 /NCGR_PEP_ID=MMETSP1075-20121228/1251_1 /TAXON_ID=2916 /ORGANISM="Ceratium fusus, Strain PA161109" /LENGTH=128 /DNA_ID=CAMNT_0013636063 /DNA_START=72 /DNA_END=454 /DNA_ORIENTATION=-
MTEASNGTVANQPAQRVGNRTSSPAPKATSQAAIGGVNTTLNKGAPTADPKAQTVADGKPQDKKPSVKPPAVGMAGLVLLVLCVLIVCIHLVYGISFLTMMVMPFAGVLKKHRIPIGIAVVGMPIGAA